MKVQIIGTDLNLKQVTEKLSDVIMNTIQKVEAEQGVNITGFSIVDSETTIKLKVEGMDEPQLLTVEHHKGFPEMFKWIVNVDKDEANSNEEESEFDEYSVAKSNGEEKQFAEIESVYSIVDLQEIVDLSETYGNMSKKVYEHKDGFRVVQLRQNRRLIQEYKLVPKEDVS